jgi:hypothetical protein
MTQPSPEESLCEALTHSDPKARRQAARELGEVGDAQSLASLGAAAVSDRSLLVRQEARQAVEKVCARTGLNLTIQALTELALLRALIPGLESDHGETRTWAMSAIHPGTVAKLIREGEAIRQLGNWATGQLGNWAVFPGFLVASPKL